MSFSYEIVRNKTLLKYAEYYPNLNNSDQGMDLTMGETLGLSLYLGLLAMFGICTNIAVLVFLCCVTKLKPQINVLLANLAVIDLISCICGTTPCFFSVIMQVKMSTYVCQYYGFVTFVGGISDAFGLAIIALERYLTVSNPFSISGAKAVRIKAMIGMAWPLAIVLASLPLFSINRYTHEGTANWCSLDWETTSSAARYYLYSIFTVVFLIPISIMMFSYIKVVAIVKEVAAHSRSGQCNKAEKHVTLQAIVMTVGFVLAWTPYAILSFGKTLGYGPFTTSKLIYLPSLFAKSSFVWNPIIHLCLNKQFQRYLRDQWSKVEGSGKFDETKHLGAEAYGLEPRSSSRENDPLNASI